MAPRVPEAAYHEELFHDELIQEARWHARRPRRVSQDASAGNAPPSMVQIAAVSTLLLLLCVLACDIHASTAALPDGWGGEQWQEKVENEAYQNEMAMELKHLRQVVNNMTTALWRLEGRLYGVEGPLAQLPCLMRHRTHWKVFLVFGPSRVIRGDGPAM